MTLVQEVKTNKALSALPQEVKQIRAPLWPCPLHRSTEMEATQKELWNLSKRRNIIHHKHLLHPAIQSANIVYSLSTSRTDARYAVPLPFPLVGIDTYTPTGTSITTTESYG